MDNDVADDLPGGCMYDDCGSGNGEEPISIILTLRTGAGVEGTDFLRRGTGCKIFRGATGGATFRLVMGNGIDAGVTDAELLDSRLLFASSESSSPE